MSLCPNDPDVDNTVAEIRSTLLEVMTLETGDRRRWGGLHVAFDCYGTMLTACFYLIHKMTLLSHKILYLTLVPV